MARILTVYTSTRQTPRLEDMSIIRWWKISEALARLGHEVDIATNEYHWWLSKKPVTLGSNLRKVSLRSVDWSSYDVVKTLFHRGFETLCRFGGQHHPCLISKLGSVVGPDDRPGIFFYGGARQRMFEIQQQIAQTSTYVTLLSQAAIELWQECFGTDGRLLLVPGGVDAVIPAPGPDPYPDKAPLRCIFSGNIYTQQSQPEANTVLIKKLNQLGRSLQERGIRLYLLGPGETSGLDQSSVTYLGACNYKRSWDYLHHAQAGLVVTAGGRMHNNESTKIYHYLRAGLPVVSEAGFPNDHVVSESGLGFVVAHGDMTQLAEKVQAAMTLSWDRDRAKEYILKNHTWDARAAVYNQVIPTAMPSLVNPHTGT